jgi:hypothetical protein
MDRRSKYHALEWIVECKRPPNPATWWESIAAFNSDRVALAYAKDCSTPTRLAEGWNYRVMKRVGNRYVEITKAEF